MLFVSVVAHEFDKDCTEQREHQRLNQSDEEFHKVEGKSREESELPRNESHEAFEELLTAEDVTEKTEAESDRTDDN